MVRFGMKFKLRGMFRVTVSVRGRTQEVPGGEPLAVKFSPLRAEWRLHGSLQFRLSFFFSCQDQPPVCATLHLGLSNLLVQLHASNGIDMMMF